MIEQIISAKLLRNVNSGGSNFVQQNQRGLHGRGDFFFKKSRALKDK